MIRPCTLWSATRTCSGPAVGERMACPPSERGTRCCTNGCGGLHQGNACRWYRKTGAVGSTEPTVCRTAACAIVPAYPNELTPPDVRTSASRRAQDCNDRCKRLVSQNAAWTCELSDRSCAFGVKLPSSSCTISLSAPANPAPGSVCPTFAFRLPTANGQPSRRPPPSRNTAAAAPASIGSPSAVPVPCASRAAALSGPNICSSSHAAKITARWAWPLGAVRLALRPSCRTALPADAISMV
eukprot:2704218-Prymnesium_polylepis.1